jgi:hypothetical protein
MRQLLRSLIDARITSVAACSCDATIAVRVWANPAVDEGRANSGNDGPGANSDRLLVSRHLPNSGHSARVNITGLSRNSLIDKYKLDAGAIEFGQLRIRLRRRERVTSIQPGNGCAIFIIYTPFRGCKSLPTCHLLRLVNAHSAM